MSEIFVIDCETIAPASIGQEAMALKRRWDEIQKMAVGYSEGEVCESLLAQCSLRGIKPGNAKKSEALRALLERDLAKTHGKAALLSYKLEICTVSFACLRGGVKDLDHYRETGEFEEPSSASGVFDASGYEDGEAGMLRDLWATLSFMGGGDYSLCGFNITGASRSWTSGFDLKHLRLRSLALGVRWPTHLPQTLREDRYSKKLYDICQTVDEGKCDDWLEAFGLPMKTASGTLVGGMTAEERSHYCYGDALRERLLYCALNRSNPNIQEYL